MPVEWEECDDWRTRADLADGLLCADKIEGGWVVFVFSHWLQDEGEPKVFPTREAAKSAAEAEARRVLLEGLRALGWPDDAAVRQGAIAMWGDAAPLPKEMDDMRAALTAAVEAPDGQ